MKSFLTPKRIVPALAQWIQGVGQRMNREIPRSAVAFSEEGNLYRALCQFDLDCDVYLAVNAMHQVGPHPETSLHIERRITTQTDELTFEVFPKGIHHRRAFQHISYPAVLVKKEQALPRAEAYAIYPFQSQEPSEIFLRWFGWVGPWVKMKKHWGTGRWEGVQCNQRGYESPLNIQRYQDQRGYYFELSNVSLFKEHRVLELYFGMRDYWLLREPYDLVKGMELAEKLSIGSVDQKFALGSLNFGAATLLNTGWWATVAAGTPGMEEVRQWMKKSCDTQDLLLVYERLCKLKVALDKAGYPYLFQQEFAEAKNLIAQGDKRTGASVYRKIVSFFAQVYCTELILKELAQHEESRTALTS